MIELDIAERVLVSLEGTPRGRRPDPGGIPGQYASVLAILDANGGTMARSELLKAINASRETRMPAASLGALLSKMAAADHIVRTNGDVSRAQRNMIEDE